MGCSVSDQPHSRQTTTEVTDQTKLSRKLLTTLKKNLSRFKSNEIRMHERIDENCRECIRVSRQTRAEVWTLVNSHSRLAHYRENMTELIIIIILFPGGSTDLSGESRSSFFCSVEVFLMPSVQLHKSSKNTREFLQCQNQLSGNAYDLKESR